VGNKKILAEDIPFAMGVGEERSRKNPRPGVKQLQKANPSPEEKILGDVKSQQSQSHLAKGHFLMALKTGQRGKGNFDGKVYVVPQQGGGGGYEKKKQIDG